MAPPLDLFVFDLAGTTVADDGQVLSAFLRTAEAFAVPVSDARLRARLGWHGRVAFESVLAEAGMSPELAPRMAQQFEREFANGAVVAPLRPATGAEQAIRRLRAAGIGVAFNTGFGRATANLVLRTLGWDHLPSVASDEVPRSRPFPDLILRAMQLRGIQDPWRVGVAGDSPADLEAGTAAGCRLVVGVCHGSHSREELEGAPHTHLLPTLAGLGQLIHALG